MKKEPIDMKHKNLIKKWLKIPDLEKIDRCPFPFADEQQDGFDWKHLPCPGRYWVCLHLFPLTDCCPCYSYPLEYVIKRAKRAISGLKRKEKKK